MLNHSELDTLAAHDRDSRRLRELLKISSECLVYISYKLDKPTQALVFADAFELITNSSIDELIDAKLVTNSNEFDMSEFTKSTRFETNLKWISGSNPSPLVRYKLIFDAKLMYVFVIDQTAADGLIRQSRCVKLSEKLLDLVCVDDRLVLQLFDSRLDYVCAQLVMTHNDWVKKNLNEFEYRNMPVDNRMELEKLRIQNRQADFKLFEHFLKENNATTNKVGGYFYEYELDSIDGLMSEVCFDDVLMEALTCKNLDSLETRIVQRLGAAAMSIETICEAFREIVIKPIESMSLETGDEPITIVVDSKFSKMFALVLGMETQLVFSLCPDSFEFYSGKILSSAKKERRDEIQLNDAKQKVNKLSWQEIK